MSAQGAKQPLITLAGLSALSCFGGGIATALLGSLFTASTWIWGAATHPFLRNIGTALLILTIPLLILAGHCMDWMEREQKKGREKRR